jgi:hypothetical protein
MGYLPRSETHSGAAATTLAQLAAPFRESTLFTMAQVRGGGREYAQHSLVNRSSRWRWAPGIVHPVAPTRELGRIRVERTVSLVHEDSVGSEDD